MSDAMADSPSETTLKVNCRRPGNTFQWTDNFSKVKGSHSLKFGGDVRRQQFNQFFITTSTEIFRFSRAARTTLPEAITLIPIIFLGTPTRYSQGRCAGENTFAILRLYLFAQDSWKIRSNVTLNYGLRWELNTPYIDTQNRSKPSGLARIPRFIPAGFPQTGADTINNAAGAGTVAPGDCGPTSTQSAYFPTGLVFPGDKGVPQGLTSTYYKAIAPRIGLAYSPNWSDGVLGAIAGGPGKSTIRGGFGIFYNPIEQLVMEQFSAEPPFGVSAFASSPLFNTPFILQEWLPASEQRRRRDQPDAQYALLRSRGSQRLRGLVVVPFRSAVWRIPAAPEDTICGAIQLDS